jgi:hypothetical protein
LYGQLVNLGFEGAGDNIVVVVDVLKDLVLTFGGIVRGVDHNEDGEYNEAEHRNKVAPYVCSFVVDHEQTPEVQSEIMKIDPVSEGNVFVVDQPRVTCPCLLFRTDEGMLVDVDI